VILERFIDISFVCGRGYLGEELTKSFESGGGRRWRSAVTAIERERGEEKKLKRKKKGAADEMI
jgi:hypothetical protein